MIVFRVLYSFQTSMYSIEVLKRFGSIRMYELGIEHSLYMTGVARKRRHLEVNLISWRFNAQSFAVYSCIVLYSFQTSIHSTRVQTFMHSLRSEFQILSIVCVFALYCLCQQSHM